MGQSASEQEVQGDSPEVGVFTVFICIMLTSGYTLQYTNSVQHCGIHLIKRGVSRFMVVLKIKPAGILNILLYLNARVYRPSLTIVIRVLFREVCLWKNVTCLGLRSKRSKETTQGSGLPGQCDKTSPMAEKKNSPVATKTGAGTWKA